MKNSIKGRLCPVGLLALIALPLSAQEGSAHEAGIQAIRDNEARWNQEFQRRDLDATMAHYADDATMVAPGFGAFRGRDAIRGALEQMLADPAFSLRFQTSRIEIAKGGDVAWSEGSYTVTATGPGTKRISTSRGSYVTVYRLEEDAWKAVSDIASPGPEPGGQK